MTNENRNYQTESKMPKLKEYHCKECGSTDMWYEVQTRYYWIPETSTYDEDEHHFGWYCNNCYMQGVEVYSALKD